ncbi:hypothetical protein LTR84_005547 [Exophiala bonariae]|uniref:Cytochrome P450 n=1 Tax=Exophiala bonariae TaxID=1690606 RepID=A0AAV9N6C3_9EURO|nr:hypothetical protein LTR84_005547 [Exophiala bonariae]
MTRFPGPVLARWTGWWLIWHELSGNREKVIDQLHRTYGPVVQISPKQISVNNHAGFHEIFAMNRRLDRPPLLLMHNYGSENMFSTVDGNLHQQRRQPMRNLYAVRSIESSDVQRVFKSALEDFTQYIDTHVTQERSIDIYLLFRYLGCDIMSSIIYGPKHSLRLLHHERNRQVFEKDLIWIDKRFMCLATLIIFLFPRLSVILRRIGLMQKSFDESLPGNSKLKWTAREAMQDCHLKQTSPEGHQLESHVEKLSAHYQRFGKSQAIPDENYILSDSLDHFTAALEVYNEGGLTRTSGFSTTADALSAILFHLSQPANFSRQERLRTELREHAISNDSNITVEQTKKVGFLECIIKETLRTNPPMPVSLERTVPLNHSIEIHEGTIHGGTQVGAQAFSIHRNETAFPDPEVWRPERWDIPHSSAAYTLMRRHFFAFGAGPRMCIGMNIAMTQLRRTLALVYSRYQTSLGPEWFDKSGKLIDFEEMRKVVLLSDKSNQMVQFEKAQP